MNKIKNIRKTIIVLSLLLFTLSLSGCNIPLFKKEELKVIGIVIPPLKGAMGGGFNGYAGSSTPIDVKYGWITPEVQIILNKELPKTFNKVLYTFFDGIMFKVIPRNASKEEYNIDYNALRYRTEGNSIYFGIPVIIGLEKWYNTTVLILPEGIRAKDGSTLKKDWFVFVSVEALNPYSKVDLDYSSSEIRRLVENGTIKRPVTLIDIYKEYNDNRTVAYVLNNETPLIESPQPDSKEIFKVYAGETCEVVEQLENGWYKVVFYSYGSDTLKKSIHSVVPHDFDVYKNWLDSTYGYLPSDSIFILPSPLNPGFIITGANVGSKEEGGELVITSPGIGFGYANLLTAGIGLTAIQRKDEENIYPIMYEMMGLFLASNLVTIVLGSIGDKYSGFALKELNPNGIKEDTPLLYSLKWSNKDLQDFKRIYKVITDFMKKTIKDFKIQKEYQPFIDNYLEAFDKKVAFYLAYHEWGQKYKAESVEPFVSLLLENLNLSKDDEEKIKSFFVCKENATMDECFGNGIDKFLLEYGPVTAKCSLYQLGRLARYKLYKQLKTHTFDYSGKRVYDKVIRLDKNKFLCITPNNSSYILYWDVPPVIEETFKSGCVYTLYSKPLPILDKQGPVYEVVSWKMEE